LCVDNDQEILDGMRALLGRWQVQVTTASTVDQALEEVQAQPDVMLVAYHLHDRLDGLDTLVALRVGAGRGIPRALLTAE
ncbi:response regulator, partial [Stenotrophomonas sp. GbtcB23]|uniref:response regulator n=1 Tax=Stenotrophomonas sp. GbtcB23 TaxID=2824768 RepID=UPI001C2F4442